MRWDTIILVAIIAIFSVQDAGNRAADRAEVAKLSKRVEELEKIKFFKTPPEGKPVFIPGRRPHLPPGERQLNHH